MTERLARASMRHPWRVVGAWITALVISFGAVGALLGGVLTSEAELTNDPESYRAYDLIAERLPPDPDFVSEVIVVRHENLTTDDAAFRQNVSDLARALERLDDVTVVDAPASVSPDRHAALITLRLENDPEGTIVDVVERVEAADEQSGFDVEITGEWTADNDFGTLSQEDLEQGELFFGLPVSLVVLLIVFGAVVAGLLPLLMAVVSIVVALALTALVGQVWDLSVFVVNMLTGMGLALGIDYTLFVLSRFREERSAGREKTDAIATAGATASRAVVFSGLAYVLAMTGLLLVPSTIFRSLALGAILVGMVSVAAALTLLPAVLSLLGDRVNALRLPFFGRSAAAESRFWSAIVRGVMRKPVVSLVASVGLLIAAAAPVLDLHTGEAGLSTLPERFPARQGFEAFNDSFGVGTTDTVQVVVDGDVESEPVAGAIRRLEGEMRTNRVLRQVNTDVHADERLAIVEALPAGDSRDEHVIAAVERLRDDVVPRAFARVDAEVLVSGETAEAIDYFAVTERWLPIVLAFVLALSFVLLTIAFRSLVVPLKAIVLNLLSVGAAYGLLVLVFQKGVGNEIFGFEQVEAVEAWVPLFLFSVLFGLSMDYHVFLLSRIRERYVHTGDNEEAVAHGIGSTARMITGAALIIIAVFAGFARGDLVMFQQMGFGVAVSLLIDATLIRSVVVPAAMTLLGDRNWYLPSWLSWLPRVQVEGAPQPARPA